MFVAVLDVYTAYIGNQRGRNKEKKNIDNSEKCFSKGFSFFSSRFVEKTDYIIRLFHRAFLKLFYNNEAYTIWWKRKIISDTNTKHIVETCIFSDE